MDLPIQALPILIREVGDELARDGFTCTCPAAEADGSHKVLLCNVEKSWFPVRNSPLAVKLWCAGDYTQCPSWQAQWDDPEMVARVQYAKERAEIEQQTVRQIESGIRVDDRDENARLEDLEIESLIQTGDLVEGYLAGDHDEVRDGQGNPK